MAALRPPPHATPDPTPPAPTPSPTPRRKPISPDRDRLQSQVLTASITLALLLASARVIVVAWRAGTLSPWPLALSLLFALAVWRLRAATAPAAAIGALICLLLSTPAAAASTFPISPALWPLLLLFLLTFSATRFKRRTKQASGLAEPRHGRRASQIIANLGGAGLCAALGFYPGVLAALAEATADTVSSEVGQALGGPTRLLTTLRPVAPGTDGGISLRGTIAGIAAALLIILAGSPPLPSWRPAGAIAASAVFGLLFDSLLGATAERRGWLGNDLVNATSTLAAVFFTWCLLHR